MQRLYAALASHPPLLVAARTALAAALPHDVVPIVMGQLRRLQRAEFTAAMMELVDGLRLDAVATKQMRNAQHNAIYGMALALCRHEEPAMRYLRAAPDLASAIDGRLESMPAARGRDAPRLRRRWAAALARA